MFTHKISLQIVDAEQEAAYDALHSLLGTYRQSGQILGNSFPIYQEGEKLVALVQTPEADSLNASHASTYVLNELKKQTNRLTIEQQGVPPIQEQNNCLCQHPSFFILFTHFIKTGSPLHCGDCFGEIPLYRLQNKEGYYEALRWESDYQSCDSLQMNSTVGERFAINQLSKLDSPLNQSGLEIAKKISAFSQRPVYYYLFNYKRIAAAKDRQRKCPGCEGEWLLQEPIHRLFDFKCDDCQLLSNLSSKNETHVYHIH